MLQCDLLDSLNSLNFRSVKLHYVARELLSRQNKRYFLLAKVCFIWLFLFETVLGYHIDIWPYKICKTQLFIRDMVTKFDDSNAS